MIGGIAALAIVLVGGAIAFKSFSGGGGGKREPASNGGSNGPPPSGGDPKKSKPPITDPEPTVKLNPAITDVPAKAKVGETLVITGNDLGPSGEAQFGSHTLTIKEWTATKVVVAAPSEAGKGTLSLKLADGKKLTADSPTQIVKKTTGGTPPPKTDQAEVAKKLFQSFCRSFPGGRPSESRLNEIKAKGRDENSPVGYAIEGYIDARNNDTSQVMMGNLRRARQSGNPQAEAIATLGTAVYTYWRAKEDAGQVSKAEGALDNAAGAFSGASGVQQYIGSLKADLKKSPDNKTSAGTHTPND